MARAPLAAKPLVLIPTLCLALALPAAPLQGGEETLGWTDLMRMRSISDATISEDGTWVAYTLAPDRGDGRVVARSVEGETEHTVERGSEPAISADGRWVAAKLLPPLAEREKAGQSAHQDDADAPRTGLALLDLTTGEVTTRERVESFTFSGDGRWLAYQHFEAPEEGEEEASEESSPGEAEAETEPAGEPAEPAEPVGEEEEEEPGEGQETADLGTRLVLRHLASGREIPLEHVTEHAFDEASAHLAYAVVGPEAERGIYVRELTTEEAPERSLASEPETRYTTLTWPGEDGPSRLAFVAAPEDAAFEPDAGSVRVFDAASGEVTEAVPAGAAPEGWFIPAVNELTWSRDGERLFLGFKPEAERREEEREESGEEGSGEGEAGEAFDPYDVEALLEERTVDVWHGDDPLIIPHQKRRWERERDRVYLAVHHLASGETVPLADRTMRHVEPVDNPRAVLAYADVPYLRELTWDGRYYDLYRVELADGSRQRIAERLPFEPWDAEETLSLSPEGRYVAFYRTPHWYLFDAAEGTTRNLTAALDVPFANEDHDYPFPAPAYGVAGWVEGDAALLVHDKYDVWRFPTDGSEPRRVTGGEGRERGYRYRVLTLDPEQEAYAPDERLLLSAFDEGDKSLGFAAVRPGEAGVTTLAEEDARLTFLAKAGEAPRLLYTRESYTTFPDLWVADLELEDERRLSAANPELDRFARGKAELVRWTGADGRELEGILIRPGGYEPGKRYPVLVYFYRLFSQHLHSFQPLHVNHRPSFPVYASDGYAIFLPDIRFEVGRPGLAATKALTSGVQKLVEMGVADPERIGLHGHSWSGYQTAFVITQTDLFAAAVAGAPVSNMTSAYGGIRYRSGRARQFQYEQSQSRLGESLWEGRRHYIDNSPLFFADRVETPLLMQFGDEDGAVPWTQGIELYLALRRLDKPVVFLQYRGEGHHLERYGNKLDYSMKMKAFLDHHLKGAPAPAWWSEGVPYRGE